MKKTLTATLIGLMAAFAVFAAEPKEWYDGGIAAGFPTAPTLKGGVWTWDSENADATYSNGKVSVDSDTEYPVDFNATQPADLAKSTSYVSVETVPVVIKAGTTLPTVDNCKSGFLVKDDGSTTNYYAIVKDGSQKSWKKLDGASWHGGSIKLSTKMFVEYGSLFANFTVIEGDSTAVKLTYNGRTDIEIDSTDTVSRGVSFQGSGDIYNLKGSLEKIAPIREWFNGGIASGFPTAATLKRGEWYWNTEYSDATYSNGKVDIDGDSESPIDFNASSSVDLNRGSAVITTKLIPVVVRNNLPAIPECKTSFMVYEENSSSNYYGIAKVNGARTWVKLDGATWNGGEISLNIKMRREAEDGKDYANFVVSENGGSSVTLTYNGSTDVEILVDDSKVKGLSFTGCGSLTDLTSTRQMQGGTTIPPAMLFHR